MVYLITALVAISASLIAVALLQLVPARSSAVDRRLMELVAGDPNMQLNKQRIRRERWEQVLRELGERVGNDQATDYELRMRMTRAGFNGPNAAAIFRGIRIALPLVMGASTFVFAPVAGPMAILAAAWLAGMGWVAPSFYLDSKTKKRQQGIRLAVPDALDLLVVCVEAGLGLNQAIVRVSDEIRYLSLDLSKELALVNLEIRAGKPRDEALRNLGERTDVEDLRSLSALLIQTERFGTSIATALNVQSETARTKRRQRAEEAAGKLPVKMMIPLAFCIMPALFVIAIGPAAFSFFKMITEL